MYEIIGSILSVLVAIAAIIGYRTRTDTRMVFAELVALFYDLGELLADLAVILKNIKLVKKNTLPGIDIGYTVEFCNDPLALKSLDEIPGDVGEILAHLDLLAKEISKLGSLLPSK